MTPQAEAGCEGCSFIFASLESGDPLSHLIAIRRATVAGQPPGDSEQN